MIIYGNAVLEKMSIPLTLRNMAFRPLVASGRRENQLLS
jgi:hypothetical protein